MNGSLVITWGKYGGFYLYRGGIADVLCLGWISFSLWNLEIEGVLYNIAGILHKKAIEEKLIRDYEKGESVTLEGA